MALYYGHVEQVEGPTDPGWGQGRPLPPKPGLPLPPLPPGIVAPPIALPPEITIPMPPIVIPEPPDKPLPPPGTIWPPLPPGTGIAGKALVCVWVVGVGTRWLVVDGPDLWPPVAGPKR